MRLLNIEDDMIQRQLLGERLAEAGVYVLTADSTEAALRILAKHWMPDVCLIDLNLPGKTGEQFYAEAAKLPGWDKVRVIVVTGWKGIKTLPCEVVEKPYRVEDLIASIVSKPMPLTKEGGVMRPQDWFMSAVGDPTNVPKEGGAM